jgi:hypothetical protein
MRQSKLSGSAIVYESNRLIWYNLISDMKNMKKNDVKAVLGRVLTWPAEAQRQAVATLQAIEEGK